MDRYIVAIGGGELKTKETLEIDRYIAKLAYVHAGEERPYALFIGTASHDSMPYYNTFHKTYTGELGLKTAAELSESPKTGKENKVSFSLSSLINSPLLDP